MGEGRSLGSESCAIAGLVPLHPCFNYAAYSTSRQMGRRINGLRLFSADIPLCSCSSPRVKSFCVRGVRRWLRKGGRMPLRVDESLRSVPGCK
ncbi:L-cysteine:1D-myo-inositol 2-amino-2-deoxy-alpha-D-glucopyranoside ligase [Clarias magur]|uniref:L-cysteine:1D-myo-inositol 2-amino-2-deoxy-alpha-D-glucopyranoside ligase n=1 Tax=Clarias magur TaxID=1594786 RepID=A0A8J4TE56_CLAMG|nr:L-cysteine:1D-myo-inositol 2-amino-2-deoxy-alpha-D-glucopyranoside ligase [Clarias magur]